MPVGNCENALKYLIRCRVHKQADTKFWINESPILPYQRSFLHFARFIQYLNSRY